MCMEKTLTLLVAAVILSLLNHLDGFLSALKCPRLCEEIGISKNWIWHTNRWGAVLPHFSVVGPKARKLC